MTNLAQPAPNNDPKNVDEAIGALRALVMAARRLQGAWENLDDPHVLNDGYPECLPSFDEFVVILQEWRDKFETANPDPWVVNPRKS